MSDANSSDDDLIAEAMMAAFFGELDEPRTPVPEPDVAPSVVESKGITSVALLDSDISPDSDIGSDAVEGAALDSDRPSRDGAGVDGADGDADVAVDADVADESDESASEVSVVRGLIEWVAVLVGAVVVALLLRAFLVHAYWIPSESMEETLQRQDRVLVNKLSYRLHEVNRGDVVVFRRPDDQDAVIPDLIKRVIGLGGETVEGRDGVIYVDGRALEEPYLADDEVIDDFGPIAVEEGYVFVMGDNRDQSFDSRFFGPIPEDSIIGRAFVRFWPVGRIDTL